MDLDIFILDTLLGVKSGIDQFNSTGGATRAQYPDNIEIEFTDECGDIIRMNINTLTHASWKLK